MYVRPNHYEMQSRQNISWPKETYFGGINSGTPVIMRKDHTRTKVQAFCSPPAGETLRKHWSVSADVSVSIFPTLSIYFLQKGGGGTGNGVSTMLAVSPSGNPGDGENQKPPAF